MSFLGTIVSHHSNCWLAPAIAPPSPTQLCPRCRYPQISTSPPRIHRPDSLVLSTMHYWRGSNFVKLAIVSLSCSSAMKGGCHLCRNINNMGININANRRHQPSYYATPMHADYDSDGNNYDNNTSSAYQCISPPARCSSRDAACIIQNCSEHDGLLIITCDASGRGVS